MSLGEYIDVTYGKDTVEGEWLHRCLRGMRDTLRAAVLRGEPVIWLQPLGKLVLMISQDPQRRRRRQPFYYEWRANRTLRLGKRKGRKKRMSWIDVFTLSQEMNDIDYAVITRFNEESDPTKDVYVDDLLELKAENAHEMQEGILDRARLIINWQTRAEAIEKEINELKDKQIKMKQIIKACREFVRRTMEQYEVQQIKDDLLTISVRKKADRAAIELLELPEFLPAEVRIQTPSGRIISVQTEVKNKIVSLESMGEEFLKAAIWLDTKRTDIRKALQEGHEVPGTSLITDEKTVNIRR